MEAHTSGTSNVAMGYRSLYTSSTGDSNTGIGQYALKLLTEGDNNTGVGRQAGDSITTGDNNTCIGYNAGGGQTTTDNGVFIGSNAGSSDNASNVMYIARSTEGAGNDTTWIYGHTDGSCIQGNNATAWAQTSDERIKKNITDSTKGLTEINAMQVRNFEYRTPEEITADISGCNKTGVQVGVIAQEIETVLPESVSALNSGKKVFHQDPVFWAMVKAVQELSEQNEVLAAKVEALENA